MHKEATTTFARHQGFDVDDPSHRTGTQLMASGPQAFNQNYNTLDKISEELDERARKSTVTNSIK